jgi:hypothetical protein
MLTVTVKADRNAILQKILSSRAFVEKGWVAAEKVARKRFNQQKELFFRDFDEHPVTQEIKAGPEIEGNPSGLLGGEGNLFSFFGFNEGEDPIGDVKLFMESLFDIERGSYRSKQWTFRVKMPDEEQVAAYVVGKYGADYTSESWIDGVEKGYSGLNYYLRFRDKGRSGGGIEVSSPVRELNFSTTPYLSEMVKNFRRNIQT